MDPISAYHWIDLLLLRPSLVILTLFIAMKVCRANSAATRHWLALCGLCTLPLIPLLNWLTPNAPIEILPPDWATQTVSSNIPGNAQESSDPINWLLVLYLAGFGLLMLKLIVDLLRLERLRKNLKPVDNAALLQIFKRSCDNLKIRRNVALQVTDLDMPPHAFGLIRPVVVIPRDMLSRNANNLKALLTHELAHIKRLDWPIAVLGRTVCALFWFLPWVWWLWRRVETLAENACDDQVLRQGIAGHHYAEELVNITRDKDCAFAVAAFKKRSGLYLRIRDLLDETTSHHPLGTLAKTGSLLLCSLLLVPLSALQATTIKYTANLLGAKIYPVETALPAPVARQPAPAPRSMPKPVLATIQMPGRPTDEESSHFHPPPITLTEKIAPDTLENPALTLSSIRIEGHRPLTTAMPLYPQKALQENIEGEVTVGYNINADGEVSKAWIVAAQPENIFNRSALDAVKKFRFQPQSVNGKPVATNDVHSHFRYRLTDSRRGKRQQKSNSNIANSFP